MKTDFTKVYFKHGKESKADAIGKADLDGLTLGELKQRLDDVETAFNDMASMLKKALVIQKDRDYILNHDGKLLRVKNPELYADVKGDIRWLTVENGKIVLDKKKVGIL